MSVRLTSKKWQNIRVQMSIYAQYGVAHKEVPKIKFCQTVLKSSVLIHWRHGVTDNTLLKDIWNNRTSKALGANYANILTILPTST